LERNTTQGQKCKTKCLNKTFYTNYTNKSDDGMNWNAKAKAKYQKNTSMHRRMMA
jgi:hypothetical protein